MATTTKTLTPTNQTITLPDMTERPNASVLVDGIGKDADAINALSDQIAQYKPSATQYTGDLNNAPHGRIYTGTGATNLPSAYAYWIVDTIIVDANSAVQYAIARTNGNYMSFRAKSGGAWSAWKQLAIGEVKFAKVPINDTTDQYGNIEVDNTLGSQGIFLLRNTFNDGVTGSFGVVNLESITATELTFKFRTLKDGSVLSSKAINMSVVVGFD